MQLPFDGGRSVRAPEKPNFAQTCNRLSQYIKGKGNLRDLGLEIRGKLDSAGKSDASPAAPTIDFLANIEKPNHALELDLNSTDPVPEHNGLESMRMVEQTSNEASNSKEEPRNAKNVPLTIFYSGKVMVFDDFPADKARAVMLLASKVSSQGVCATFQTASANSIDPPKRTLSPPTPQVPSQPAVSNASDLPIARRSSLHRFLEKRKDRSTARGPYPPQQHNPLPSPSSPKGDGSSSGIRDELDLNFKL